MDLVFPQHFNKCTPSFGSACQFVPICHGPQDMDPIGAGFSWREPHHEPELELWKELDIAGPDVQALPMPKKKKLPTQVEA